jgi:dienelactone hydrolase
MGMEEEMIQNSSTLAFSLLVAALGFAQPAPIQQQLTFTPYHANDIYAVGETVGWTITPGLVKPTYAYKWTIRRNNAVILKEGKLALSTGQDKIELIGEESEMIYVAVEPYASLPTADSPGEAAPAYTGGNTGRNNGLYAVGAAGNFPALIQLQYAGVYALNAHAAAQHAADGWLFINVDSHDKLPSDPYGRVPKNYQAVGNTDSEKSYFLNMYLRDSRVVDYLMTRSDWDGKTIVLTGGSMGGQQSLALAGLRPDNISAVLVCVQAGADTNADLHGRKAGYPNWPSGNPEAMKTALYFDTVNFASRIYAPVLAGMGFTDNISPPAGIWTALNQIRGAKEALPVGGIRAR